MKVAFGVVGGYDRAFMMLAMTAGSNRGVPHGERIDGSRAGKVRVRCEHDQIMCYAELRQERVNRTHIYPFPPARRAEIGRSDVIGAIRHQEGQ